MSNISDNYLSGYESYILVRNNTLIYSIIIIPIIFIPICFILIYTLHSKTLYSYNGVTQIPSISKSGAIVPESIVFTYGLHLESILLAILFVLLHHKYYFKIINMNDDHYSNNTNQLTNNSMNKYYKYTYLLFCGCCIKEHDRNKEYLLYWNKILLMLGLIGCLLMSFVGSISIQLNATTHSIIAFFMFLSFILHMLLFYFTIMIKFEYTQLQLLIHRVCLFICIPFNIILLIVGKYDSEY